MVTIYRSAFPNLADDDFSPESDPCELYNCIAWAAGVDDEWWDPLGVWPRDLSASYSAGVFVKLYERHNFVECSDSEPETGFEKIAIYVDDRGDVTHAARQLPDGKWTSKLGLEDDVEHNSLECLAGGEYGNPSRFLKRRLSP
jgi:hypothetical protein